MYFSPKILALDALLLTSFAFSHGLSKRQTSSIGNGTQVFAPLPEGIDEAEVGPEGYTVQSFGGGAYLVASGTHEAMFFASDEGVIVVDYPTSLGPGLKYAIGNVTKAPVTKFIYSHGHADHVDGAHLFAEDAVDFIAHEETASYLAQLSDPQRPVPKVTFKDKKTIKVGNQTLELSYKGPNHQVGNIFIYAPDHKILMLVDVLTPKWVPFYQLGIAESVPGFINSVDQILEFDFEHFVGGHLTRSGSRQDILVQKEYIRDLFFSCREAVYGGFDPRPLVGVVLSNNPGNLQAAAKAIYYAQAEVCANAVTPRWIDRLGGADVFGFDHALKMVLSFATDYSRTTPVPAGFRDDSEVSGKALAGSF